MYYCYILQSSSQHKFYYGFTNSVYKRIEAHNLGLVTATRSGRPWELVWYCAFSTVKEAKNFERYLKTGSGKAFAYKRLISEALAKDLRARKPIRSQANEGRARQKMCYSTTIEPVI